MSADEILLLFFGLPLAILGMGLRRALGPRALLALLLVGTIVAVWAVLVESVLQGTAYRMPLPGELTRGTARGFGPFALAASLLGGLLAILLRFRGMGSADGSAD